MKASRSLSSSPTTLVYVSFYLFSRPTLTSQDVTEIIGSGKVDLGFKAMIHTLAVRLPLPNFHP